MTRPLLAIAIGAFATVLASLFVALLTAPVRRELKALMADEFAWWMHNLNPARFKDRSQS